MYRVCCKTWKLLCTFCINLVPRVLSEREPGNEVGCKTVLRWVVKRATSLFNSFCSNVAKQVATSFILHFLEYIPRQKGKQQQQKQKKGTKNKERQGKEKYQQLSCCLPWRRLALHLIRYEQTFATTETRMKNFAKTSGTVTRDRRKKIGQQLPDASQVTIPESIAVHILAPVSFSFLKWQMPCFV